MERIFATFAVVACALAAGPCFAQQPEFDAASVKVFDPAQPPTRGVSGGPGSSDPGRIHYGGIAMISLLLNAYGVQNDQVSGPAWIEDFMGPNRYVVDATMPPGTTKEQFQQMLRNLLAERFHLVVHHETKGFPGYELVVAKDGPKPKESVPDPKTADDSAPKRGLDKDGFTILPPGAHMGQMTSSGTMRISCKEQSMAAFAASLGNIVSVALGADAKTGRPRVIDKTALTGKYDFRLECFCAGCRSLREMAPNLPLFAGRGQEDAPAQPTAAAELPGSGLPTIFAALEKQLGLKLEKVRDVPVDVIVVDRVDKVPTEN
jgi:uncharacterized protein (TIGR03435 family)